MSINLSAKDGLIMLVLIAKIKQTSIVLYIWIIIVKVCRVMTSNYLVLLVLTFIEGTIVLELLEVVQLLILSSLYKAQLTLQVRFCLFY